MRLDYKIAGASGKWVPLFDEQAGDVMENYSLAFKFLSFVSPGFGAGSEQITPQQNASVTHQILVLKTYGSLEAGLADLGAIVLGLSGQKIHLKGTEGKVVHFYPYGSLEGLIPQSLGESIKYQFSFLTENLMLSPPI